MMEERPVAKIWKLGSDVILLSEIEAIVAFGKTQLSVFLKSGQKIEMLWATDPDTRDRVAKSLVDALEMFHLERT